MNRSLLTLTILAGVVFTLGTWIPLKAMMAQELLNLAWAESQARQTTAQPWPWADTWPDDRLVLVTCYRSDPVINHGALRYVVEAKAIPGLVDGQRKVRKLFADTGGDLAGHGF